MCIIQKKSHLLHTKDVSITGPCRFRYEKMTSTGKMLLLSQGNWAMLISAIRAEDPGLHEVSPSMIR